MSLPCNYYRQQHQYVERTNERLTARPARKHFQRRIISSGRPNTSTTEVGSSLSAMGEQQEKHVCSMMVVSESG